MAFRRLERAGARETSLERRLGIDWEKALRLFGELLAVDERRGLDTGERA